jgi:hypothetical protein
MDGESVALDAEKKNISWHSRVEGGIVSFPELAPAINPASNTHFTCLGLSLYSFAYQPMLFSTRSSSTSKDTSASLLKWRLVRANLTESCWLYGKDRVKYRAHIYQDRIDTSGLHGLRSMPGLKTACLEDGTPLNYIDENTFKNELTGELLSRLGPIGIVELPLVAGSWACSGSGVSSVERSTIHLASWLGSRGRLPFPTGMPSPNWP